MEETEEKGSRSGIDPETADNPQELTKGNPQELTEQSPQEQTEQSPQEQTEQSPQEQTEQSPQEQTEQSPQEQTEQSPQEVTEQSPQEVTEQGPQEQTEQSTQEQTEQSPQELTEENPQEVPDELKSEKDRINTSLKEIPSKKSKDESKKTRKKSSGKTEGSKTSDAKRKRSSKSTEPRKDVVNPDQTRTSSKDRAKVRLSAKEKKSISRDQYHSLSRERSGKASDFERQSTARPTTRAAKASIRSSLESTVSEMSLDMDVITLTVPETSQKIVHCLVGKDLFVDKTWCMVKKKDLLEDIAIEDANSPFFHLTQKILAYKPDEMLIGYEPFATEPDQFMLCLTEDGRDEVLNKLEELKSMYLLRIQQSKAVEPKKWESLGSEEFVDQFHIKNTRKLISLEWIGDITKRCFKEPHFEDCDPDDMKNGYTCLIPTDKEKFELVFKKTQETGIQAVPSKVEAEVQTEPEIPTNASTQYAPETEIIVPDTTVTQAAMKSQDLDAFFNKYLDYLLECLNYNEVYDLYHDDYPALYVSGEETQVQQLGTYHQYQSFTDVAAIEGKLVISSSWHPNYTGIVAVAYANEIPCLMKDLEFDSDQTDYEEEKTDDEGEGGEEPELGAGARDWLEDERRERESTVENTELFEKAIKRLRDIESAKVVWDDKIQEETEEVRKPPEDIDEHAFANLLQYKEYKEPEPEEEEKPDESTTSQVSEVQGEGGEGEEGEHEEEELEPLGTEGVVSLKSSRSAFREQLEADIAEGSEGEQGEKGGEEGEQVQEQEQEEGEPGSSSVIDRMFDEESLRSSRVTARGTTTTRPHTTRESAHPTVSLKVSMSTIETVGSVTGSSARKKTHHRKKHSKETLTSSRRTSQIRDHESLSSTTSLVSSSTESKIYDHTRDIYQDSEFFDEVTDEEEIKEKQDELPLLEVNNPVLIWSFVDDLTPKLRLDSPYEVRVVSFSRHDGNLIAGGTASGQVVLWDITGRLELLEKPESLTQNQQMFRKRMEDLMNWRRDIRSKRRVRFTAVSSQKDSHLEKITDMMWIAPNLVVSDTLEILPNPSPDPTLQLITCSSFGNLHLWNLKMEPGKGDYRKTPQIFKTKERFGRLPSLDMGLSPFHKLHRIWKPFFKAMVLYKTVPVLLTGISPHAASTKYLRVHPKPPGVKEILEDRIEYRPVFSGIEDIPYSVFISNVFGEAGNLVWDYTEMKSAPDAENVMHNMMFWDSYHDGPITRLCRHPFIPSICLTIGGHVFAVWHIANPEEPIIVKRYYGVYVTDGRWSSLRPSLIRIARSDGVVEIWDLIIQNHAPATTIIVSGRVITNLSPPTLPEVKGLLGVADYNSAFCLFYIPQQFRVWTENELERLKTFISREPERKKKMKEWSEWWKENNVNLDREEKKQAEEKKKLDEEVRLEKEKQEEARKKYNEEVYKWYMRRRGKPFLGTEEAEEKWREKQEEHMHEMVMAKKKIDRTEMEILMRPIVKEEKNEALKHAKAQDRLQQADTIFRQAVELIFPKTSKEITVRSEEEESIGEECIKLVDYYFGDNFDKLADEQVEFIERSPWQFEFEWSELLEKYNDLRMLFNDRRRKRNKTLRWLRKKLREELLKEGRKVHVKKSHMARYPKRKIKRRQQNLEWLKHTYGDDYNIYWDKHQPCRRFADRKFRYAVEDVESLSFLGELAEPDVEDEEVPEIFAEGKVMSSLEMITEVGIEHIPEETFAADLDTALLTMESRSSLGVKSIPSLFQKTSKISKESSKQASFRTTEPSARDDSGFEYLEVPGMQSPQDDSDISLEGFQIDESPSMVDNQLQELEYIQQPVGAKINTLQTKRTHTTQKRDISHGIKVKVEDSISDEFVETEGSITDEVEKDEIDEDETERSQVEDGEVEARSGDIQTDDEATDGIKDVKEEEIEDVKTEEIEDLKAEEIEDVKAKDTEDVKAEELED